MVFSLPPDEEDATPRNYPFIGNTRIPHWENHTADQLWHSSVQGQVWRADGFLRTNLSGILNLIGAVNVKFKFILCTTFDFKEDYTYSLKAKQHQSYMKWNYDYLGLFLLPLYIVNSFQFIKSNPY